MRICMSMNKGRGILFVRKLKAVCFYHHLANSCRLDLSLVHQNYSWAITLLPRYSKLRHQACYILSSYKLNQHIKACYWHCKINMDEEVGLALFMQNFSSSILNRYREIADWSYLSGLRHSYSWANIPLIISIRLCHRRGSRKGKTLVKIF